MTLETLLDRAMVPKWERWEWFRDTTLAQDTLMVSDIGRLGTIERCFLERLRVVYPGLSVAFAAPARRTPPAKPGLFKAGYRPDDLLD